MPIPEIWSDLHHNIESGASGEVRKVINVDAVRSSIDNILRTNPGERVMHPEFGAGLKHLLFQPLSESLMARMLSVAQDSISKWDDRASIESVNIITDQDSNSVSLQIRISVIGLGEVITHSLLF